MLSLVLKAVIQVSYTLYCIQYIFVGYMKRVPCSFGKKITFLNFFFLDKMSLFKLMETAFEHIQATHDLQKFLNELKVDVTKEIVVPAKTSEGWWLTVVQFVVQRLSCAF